MSLPPRKRSRIFYGWWIALAGAALNMFMGGAIGLSFTAFFAPIIQEFGWSYFSISLARSFTSIESGIATPVMGFLVDRLGPRRLILMGAIVAGIGTLLLSRTNSLPLFYIAVLISALGSSAASPPVLMAAVAQWFKRDISKAMGLLTAGFGAGGLLVPVVVWLIDSFQWRTALVILGLSVWATSIPLSFVIRHKPEDYGYLPDGQTSKAGQVQVTEGGITRDFSPREAVKSKAFWLLTLSSAFQFMGVGVTMLHVMPYLASVGMSRPSAALIASLIPLVSIASRLAFGWLGDSIDKSRALTLAFGLQATGMFFFAFAPHPWALILFLLTYPAGWGGTAVVRGAILRDYFGRRSYGSILGLLMGVTTVASMIGPATAGWIFDTRGSYFPVWLGLAALFALSTPLLLSLKPPRHPSPATN